MRENEFLILAKGKDKLPHESGVALILSKSAQQSLLGYNPVSDRVISVRFKPFTGEFVVIQTYALTAAVSESVINQY